MHLLGAAGARTAADEHLSRLQSLAFSLEHDDLRLRDVDRVLPQLNQALCGLKPHHLKLLVSLSSATALVAFLATEPDVQGQTVVLTQVRNLLNIV
jgi:hypothetical protein